MLDLWAPGCLYRKWAVDCPGTMHRGEMGGQWPSIPSYGCLFSGLALNSLSWPGSVERLPVASVLLSGSSCLPSIHPQFNPWHLLALFLLLWPTTHQ